MLPTPLLLLKKHKNSAKKTSKSTTDCNFEEAHPYSEGKLKKRRKIRRTEDLSNLRRSSLAYELQPTIQGEQQFKITKKSKNCDYLPKVEIENEKENISNNRWRVESGHSGDESMSPTKTTKAEKDKIISSRKKLMLNVPADTDDDDVEFSVKLRRKKVIKNKRLKSDDTDDQKRTNKSKSASSSEPSENENATKSPNLRSKRPTESILKTRTQTCEIEDKLEEQSIRLTRKSVRFITPKEKSEKKRNTFDLENPITDINLLNSLCEENDDDENISKQNVRKATPHIKRSIEHSFDSNLTKQQLFDETSDDDVFENEAVVVTSDNLDELPDCDSANKLLNNEENTIENGMPSTVHHVQTTDAICRGITTDKKPIQREKIESFTPNKFGTRQNKSLQNNGLLSRSTLDLTSKTPRKSAVSFKTIDKSLRDNKLSKSLTKKSDILSKSLSSVNKTDQKKIQLNKSLNSCFDSAKKKKARSSIRELNVSRKSCHSNEDKVLQSNTPQESTKTLSSMDDTTNTMNGLIENQDESLNLKKSKTRSSTVKVLNVSQKSVSSTIDADEMSEQNLSNSLPVTTDARKSRSTMKQMEILQRKSESVKVSTSEVDDKIEEGNVSVSLDEKTRTSTLKGPNILQNLVPELDEMSSRQSKSRRNTNGKRVSQLTMKEDVSQENDSMNDASEIKDITQRSENLSIINISSDVTHYTLNDSDKNLLMNNSDPRPSSSRKSLRRSCSAPSIPNAEKTAATMASLLRREGTFSLDDAEGSIINLLDDSARQSAARSGRKRWDKSMNMSNLELTNANLMDISPPKWSKSMNTTKTDDDVLNTPGAPKLSAKKFNGIFVSSTPFNNPLQKMQSYDMPASSSTPLNIIQNRVTTKAKTPSITMQNDVKMKSATKSKPSTRKKMPNFALIHQKAYEKMESIQQLSERRAARAQQLLSGQKPQQAADISSSQRSTSSSSSNKSPMCRKPLKYTPSKLVKKAAIPVLLKPSKKSPRRLEINIATTIEIIKPSISNPKVRITKTSQASKERKHVSSSSSCIPKPLMSKNNVVVDNKKPAKEKVLSKFGFKVNHPMLNKKEDEVKAVATKSSLLKPTTETRRNTVQNIRTNRRFELLMKMRNNSKK